MNKDSNELINPKVKDVLILVGVLGFVAASIVMPNLPLVLKPILDVKKRKDLQHREKLWKMYNPYELKKLLKRLHQQKDIEFIDNKDGTVIRLTDKGKTKFLKYRLDEMHLQTQKWDGRWRLIIYDVPHFKKTEREMFRRFLKSMAFYQLQESVYLTPFNCYDEIEYLRTYFGVVEEVIYLTVNELENDSAYRQYFGI